MKMTDKQKNYIVKLDPNQNMEALANLTIKEASILIKRLLKGAKPTTESQEKIFDYETFKALFWQQNYDYYTEQHFKNGFKYSLRLGDYWLTIDNPTIKTSFCFADDYDTPEDPISARQCHNARTNQDYFREKNLEGVNKWIKQLESQKYVFVLTSHYNEKSLVSICPCDFCGTKENPTVLYGYFGRKLEQGKDYIRIMTEEERQKVLKAYKQVKADFEKRLDTYLKKYGLSKLHVWTYWANA